jgi:ribosomal protein L12E/L44/L45/RPP1/RPP2
LQHWFAVDTNSHFSSSIIEKTLLDTGSDSDVVVAYFYFTFNDPAKQTCDSLLRSLIFQILSSRSTSEKSLSRLHNDCHGGMRQPTISELTGLLKEMLESIPSMYLILDALDECTDREDLLRLLKDINMWSQTNTRILVTSREEQDIKHALKAFATTSISIQGSGVDADIYKYIEERLLSDPKLARWKGDDRREITSTISQSSQGM